MAESSISFDIPDLPDEKEYPAQLTAKYELQELFAESEETRTLLAADRKTGTPCVVKCWMKKSCLYDRSEPEELRAMNAPPMPKFLAEYRNENMRCILREYVPGETLAAYAARESLSTDEIIRVGMELCDQLQILHGMNEPVIHRDIKPENVIIGPEGKAVLIDFGIARIHKEKETDTVVFGTQGFAPPEQYGFAQTDARSDIYSLGILLNWLLYGTTKLPQTQGCRLDRVIARCTRFNPRHRYHDAGMVKKALQAARPDILRRQRYIYMICGAFLAAAAAAGCTQAVKKTREAVKFNQPLIEKAVRENLGLTEDMPIRAGMLNEVRGIYIAADAAFPDQDSFYSAVNEWYAEGKTRRGDLENLDELRAMSHLEQVCVAAQELTDISALSELEMLNKVELKHNYIEDITPLAGMKHLTSVGINDNPVRDITPLANCPNLAFLDLCDVRNYDPSVISSLGNFDFLDISNPTESYRYLNGKSILDLRIAWTGLDDIHLLDHVSRLERLEIDHSDVKDLSPLSRHTGLKKLRLTGVPAADLSVLKELPQLEEVTLGKEMETAARLLGEVPFTILYE